MATEASDNETPMLERTVVVDGAVDYKGRPALRSSSGGWRSASFIIGVEIAERFAYFGVGSNLITYLTGPLGQSTAAAAANVNALTGTGYVLPLLAAAVADSFLGRFRTIVAASMLYVLGLGLLTVSAILPCDCQTSDNMPCSPPIFQVVVFFFSIYLVAVAQSAHKPCTQAFGADQFDNLDPVESEAKSSFFNWWYFGVCAGATVTIFVVSYIQENVNWAVGFGIPCAAMVIALVVFLHGKASYRHVVPQNEKGPFARIGGVFVAAFRNHRTDSSTDVQERCGVLSHQSSERFKFLNKAATISSKGTKQGSPVCSPIEVEEAKTVLGLIPIWATCLVYGIVFAQTQTFFTKQGATMDRTIILTFQIPAASLQCFQGIAILASLPIYDRLFVPIARSFTQKPSGITMLQRIGAGILISIFSMVIAAMVEIKRLRIAEEYGLVDQPSATLPMSVWWLVPQYIIGGIADVFTMVGMQEFFYDQVPTELGSVGLALYLSVGGFGSFLSTFLVSIIDKATGGGSDGEYSWFSDNINKAHLDYFYCLLAGLSALGFASYLCFAKSYVYNRKVI